MAIETRVVLNPHAGSAEAQGEALRAAAERYGWQVVETEGAGDATRLAREAAREGVARVLAAGGDGTLSQVAQGLMDSEHRPVFGVLPLGTGNDLARTLCMPTDMAAACEWLHEHEGETGRADMLHVRSERAQTWALNSVNGGVSNEVRRNLDPELKKRLGPLAFVVRGLEMATDVPTWDLSLRIDDGPMQELSDVAMLAVANGRSSGGGFQLAPADIEDGQFDLVAVPGDRIFNLLDVAVRAKLGVTLGRDQVDYQRGRSLYVRCPDDFAFTVDGESFQGSEVHVELKAHALPFVAGPDYGEQRPRPADPQAAQ